MNKCVLGEILESQDNLSENISYVRCFNILFHSFIGFNQIFKVSSIAVIQNDVVVVVSFNDIVHFDLVITNQVCIDRYLFSNFFFRIIVFLLVPLTRLCIGLRCLSGKLFHAEILPRSVNWSISLSLA